MATTPPSADPARQQLVAVVPPSPPSNSPTPIVSLLNFILGIGSKLGGGVSLPLADGTSLLTPIPPTGGRITAETVRVALEFAEADFRRRGEVGDAAALLCIQRFVIFQAVLIQYLAEEIPGRSVPRLSIEQSAAVAALQTSLSLLERPEHD